MITIDIFLRDASNLDNILNNIDRYEALLGSKEYRSRVFAGMGSDEEISLYVEAQLKGQRKFLNKLLKKYNLKEPK